MASEAFPDPVIPAITQDVQTEIANFRGKFDTV